MDSRPNGLVSLAAALILALVLSACGGAAPAAGTGNIAAAPTAAPATGAQAAMPDAVAPPAPQAAEMTALPAPTGAPAPTQAPTQAPADATAPTQDEALPPTPPPAPARLPEMTRTVDDRLSTFALDVDTASYSVARSYLEGGALPPAEGVRIEEFVNYFDYDYPNPEGAFGITVDAAPSPFRDGAALVRVGVQGRTIDAGQRADALLTFVIDVSGSMQAPERLPLVKDSLRALLDELRDSDQVAIVVYGSEARVLLEHTPAAERDRIMAAIDQLGSEGSTNAEAGLQLGYELAARSFRPGANNRVILCSDGVANVGATGPDAILRRIRDQAAQGVYLTTVGFGMGGYNDNLMEQLADDGNGNYAYVDDLDEARRVFVENLTGMLQVIAKDAKVQVEFDPAVVASYRLLGYENRAVADADFRNDTVDAGEVGAGHSATALYEVVLTGQGQGTALTVQLRYADPASGEVSELRQPFEAGAIGQDMASAPLRLQQAAAVAGFAEALRGSTPDRAAWLAVAEGIVQRIAPQLANDADVQELAQLIARARQLAG